jgi:hypothetical protein
MTDTDYADPAAGNGDAFKPAEHRGALLLITNIRQEMDVVTEFGTANPIACNVAVLDGDHKGDTFTDTFLFGVALINKLKTFAGTDTKVLARLGQGDAKPGRSAPWILDPATEDDKAIARRYEAHIATTAAAPAEEPF